MDVLEEKKGEDIILLDVQEIASFTDYFVICSCTSERMLDALSSALIVDIKSNYGLFTKVEGEARGGWLVLDYGDVVVHLFSPEKRRYYHLEELWEKGKTLLRVQ